MYKNFSDILRDENFVEMAAFVRTPFRSAGWRNSRPEFPFHTKWNRVVALCRMDNAPWDKSAVVVAWSDLLLGITTSNPHKLRTYSTNNYEWLLSVIDSDQHKVIIGLLLAAISAPVSLWTPAELEEVSGVHAVTWRQRAQAGKIPGAIKKGKTWLLPSDGLWSFGFDAPRKDERRV